MRGVLEVEEGESEMIVRRRRRGGSCSCFVSWTWTIHFSESHLSNETILLRADCLDSDWNGSDAWSQGAASSVLNLSLCFDTSLTSIILSLLDCTYSQHLIFYIREADSRKLLASTANSSNESVLPSTRRRRTTSYFTSSAYRQSSSHVVCYAWKRSAGEEECSLVDVCQQALSSSLLLLPSKSKASIQFRRASSIWSSFTVLLTYDIAVSRRLVCQYHRFQNHGETISVLSIGASRHHLVGSDRSLRSCYHPTWADERDALDDSCRRRMLSIFPQSSVWEGLFSIARSQRRHQTFSPSPLSRALFPPTLLNRLIKVSKLSLTQAR